MSFKQDFGPEHLIGIADRDGIACSTVADGHILVFTLAHVKNMLAQMTESGQDKCIVFVKRPDFVTAN